MSSNDYVWKNDFIDSYDTFLFDCDGVLWHENDVIGGAVKVIGELIQLKKRVIFITNNSGKSRREYADKIISMGFPIQKATESVEELVLCSSFALAQYLKKLSTNPITTGDDSGKKSFNHEVDKVLVIGDSGIGLELGYENIQFVDTRQMFPNHLSRAQLAKLPLDPTIRAVAVGIDDQLTYTKVAYAVAHLKADPTILFISTNDDANLPTAGHVLPGAGSCVAIVEVGAERKDRINMGKPEPLMLELAVELYGIQKNRSLMIGDRLETDILFGIRAGIPTLLVETGIHTRAHVTQPGQSIQPNYILPSIGDLL